ncbi:unnamed protein product [Sphagnum jensenii]|uniref:Uncharacterized protein n=1 Tax=Sphagnum jensenii TaxID=128206 RepID=A0ABP1AT60_9BRYO
MADRIRKAGRDVQQGLGKFKWNKPNLNGDGDARASTLTSNENSFLANGSLDPSAQGSHEALSASSFPLSGSPLSKEGKKRKLSVDGSSQSQ